MSLPETEQPLQPITFPEVHHDTQQNAFTNPERCLLQVHMEKNHIIVL